MRTARSLFVVLLLVALVAGCATTGAIKPWSQRTPQEKSLSFMQMYNQQYADTMRVASTPGLTEGQKAMVRTKKDLLSKVKPAVEAYDAIVVEGRIPAAELEGKIIELLDKLAASGG